MKKEVLTMRIEEGRNRAFPFIRDILAFDALVIAAIKTRRGYKPGEDIGSTAKGCEATGIEIIANVDGYIEAVDTGAFPTFIEFDVAQGLPKPSLRSQIKGLQSVGSRTEMAIFALFVELAADWIKRNKTTNYHHWPPLANFCRVVRNAVVHGGKINIKSQTAPVVRWKNVEIGYKNYGEEIFVLGRLSPGDLIILMLDLDRELSALGAPFHLA